MKSDHTELPRVSILLAARNEEKNILACLQSLARLDYPTSRLEVLIGDDHSQDNTAALVADFIKDQPNFRLIRVGHNLGLARGKANALAWLAREAVGDYFLITDADVEVAPGWIEAMIRGVEPGTGIVTGFTLVAGPGIFAKIQALDMALALGLIHLAACLGIPLTAMGNNMLLRRAAYESVGGYEQLPFSVTEDFALFWALVKKGWRFEQRCRGELLNLTRPVENFGGLLQQRRRWMDEVFGLPPGVVLTLLAQALLLPLLLLLLCWEPLLALGLWLFYMSVQWLVLLLYLGRLRRLHFLLVFPFYHLFMLFFYPVLLLYFLSGKKISWKGREYSK